MTDVTQQLADALRAAEDALASSYEVADYPANGRSQQDVALAKVHAALTAYEASRAAPDDVVAWGALSYFEKIRRLPAPDAAQLLDALLDRMWVNGAQAGQSERDALQAAAFERHVSDRRREANAAIAALSAIPAPADDGPSFGPLDPRVHDLGTWEPARDEAALADLALDYLHLAQPEFCSARCPSVGREGEPIPHLPECVSMRSLLDGLPFATPGATISTGLMAKLKKLANYLTEQGEYEACDLIDTVVDRLSATPPAPAQEPR